jgi:hypothetical protein
MHKVMTGMICITAIFLFVGFRGCNKYGVLELFVSAYIVYGLSNVDRLQKSRIQEVPDHDSTINRTGNQLIDVPWV